MQGLGECMRGGWVLVLMLSLAWLQVCEAMCSRKPPAPNILNHAPFLIALDVPC